MPTTANRAHHLALVTDDRKADLVEANRERRNALVTAQRLERALPKTITRREKEAGKEAAYRGTVAEAHRALHEEAALAAGRVVDHGQAVNQTLLRSINARVRQVQDPDDRAEVAENARQWKAMGTRQQLALAEAAVRNIADLVHKPIYRERTPGLVGTIAEKLAGS